MIRGSLQKRSSALHVFVGLEGGADGIVRGGCVGGAYGDLLGGTMGLAVMIGAILHVTAYALDVVTAEAAAAALIGIGHGITCLFSLFGSHREYTVAHRAFLVVSVCRLSVVMRFYFLFLM